MFDGNADLLSTIFSAVRVSDEETKQVIKEVDATKGYLMDPHGAVGYIALKNYLKTHPEFSGIFAETAHPIKFYDVVEEIIHRQIPLPDAIQSLMQVEKKSTAIEADYEELKSYLLSMNH
jgi:threonine synthase